MRPSDTDLETIEVISSYPICDRFKPVMALQTKPCSLIFESTSFEFHLIVHNVERLFKTGFYFKVVNGSLHIEAA